MPITMYAYSAADCDDSDPDELFNVEAADPAAVMKQHFPNARLTFKHEDEGQFVYDVIESDDTIAVLYASEDIADTAPTKKPTPKATKAPAKNAIPAGRLSSREVAEALGVAPARLRVFLRSTGSKFTPVGSGARYSFTKTDLAAIKKAFPAWEKKVAAEKKAK